MSFVNQVRPGSISNDIIHDIYKELKKSNLSKIKMRVVIIGASSYFTPIYALFK